MRTLCFYAWEKLVLLCLFIKLCITVLTLIHKTNLTEEQELLKAMLQAVLLSKRLLHRRKRRLGVKKFKSNSDNSLERKTKLAKSVRIPHKERIPPYSSQHDVNLTRGKENVELTNKPVVLELTLIPFIYSL